MEDDGTNSFLAFLTAAQEDKNAPKAVEKFNDDANLLAQLTNDRGEPKVPPPKSLPRAAPPAPGLIAARPVRRSPKSAHSWQPDQDEVLRKAVAENGGKNWKSIASSVPCTSPTVAYAAAAAEKRERSNFWGGAGSGSGRYDKTRP